MSETAALMEIAGAINNLAGAILGMTFLFILFFFFKKMG